MCQDGGADPQGSTHVVCYTPTRSPVLIFRPLRSWTISSERPGQSPALSMPMFPANPGHLEGCVSRGHSQSPPNSGRPLVPLRERILARYHRRRGREEDAGRGEGHYPFPTRRTLALWARPLPADASGFCDWSVFCKAGPAAPSADQMGKRGGLATRTTCQPQSCSGY